MLLLVLHQHLGNCSHQGVFGIGVGQEEPHTQQHLVHGQGGAPLFLQDIQTNLPLGVDVAVVDSCTEGHCRRLERIFPRENDVQNESATLVGRSWRTFGRVAECRGSCKSLSVKSGLNVLNEKNNNKFLCFQKWTFCNSGQGWWQPTLLCFLL